MVRATRARSLRRLTWPKFWAFLAYLYAKTTEYGMGTSAERSSSNTEYFTRGDKIPGIQVNGMDIIASAQAVKYARDWVIAGKGPLLLEFVTYRYGGHSCVFLLYKETNSNDKSRMSDHGTTYRTREEVQCMCSTQDPIRGLQHYIEE